jgi:transcriptional regulator with XRE-family HTH domain
MATAKTRRGAKNQKNQPEPGLGDRLQEARIARGLSASGLSGLAGLSQSHVGQIERGEVRLPSGEVVLALAEKLHVSVRWLLTGKGLGPMRSPIKRTGTDGK